MLLNFRAAALTSLFIAITNAQVQFPIYIDEPRDAASNERGIAAGGMFIVKGTYSLPPGLNYAPLPLPTTFNGVTVSLVPADNLTATPIHAFLYYTFSAPRSGPQIAAVLPSATPAGRYQMTLKSGERTATNSANVLRTKFRFLANNQDGYGTAVAQDQSYNRILFSAPARPGEVLILWGLGLGGISKPDNQAPGAIDMRTALNVRASIGGIDAAVLYAGRAPLYPGIDQVNLMIPSDAPSGCNVAVTILVGGEPSNPVTIPIAPAGSAACGHPRLSPAQLRDLDNGRTFRTGQFHFTIYSEPYQDIPYVQIHSAAGFFNDYAATHAGAVAPSSVAAGRCVLFRGNPNAWGNGLSGRLLLDAPVDDSYNAGRVTVSGGAIPSVPLDGDDDYYYKLFSAFREGTESHVAGTTGQKYTVGSTVLEGGGGEDIGVFQAAIPMPPHLNWTNRGEPAEIARSAPLLLRWTGNATGDVVFAQGFSGNDEFITTFICAAAPGAQSITIPAAVLQVLPQGNGLLRVATFGPGVAFAAPGAPGPNTLNYLLMHSKAVDYR